MEIPKFVPCEDKIEVDDMICEMSVERLLFLKGLILMCHDCDGCEGMIKEIDKELKIKNQKK